MYMTWKQVHMHIIQTFECRQSADDCLRIFNHGSVGLRHRWVRYFKKVPVAERALNAKQNFLSAKALALYKAFKAIAAQKKKILSATKF